MTPQMIAALSSGRATVTALYEIDFPSGTRRLMFGSGETQWGANKFVGTDDTFGSLDTSDDIPESADGQAPNTSFTIQVASGADKAEFAGPEAQLAPARIWLGALQLDGSGHVQVVPDPEPLFEGFIDQAVIMLDRSRDEVDFSLISGFDYFFEDTEGQRLSSQFHRSVWTGEAGLDNVSGITKKVYWATNAPPGALGGSGSIYGGGGGISGGGRLLNQADRQ